MAEIIVRTNLRVLQFEDATGEYTVQVVLDRDGGRAYVQMRVGLGNEWDAIQSLTAKDASQIKSWGIETENRLLKTEATTRAKDDRPEAQAPAPSAE